MDDLDEPDNAHHEEGGREVEEQEEIVEHDFVRGTEGRVNCAGWKLVVRL